MASLSKTRIIFGFTSPRTLEKSIPEIDLLIREFSNQRWNKTTQTAFFCRLLASDFYEDERPTKDLDFAGRDRITRAPKAYGFVSLTPVISITPVGERLLEGGREAEIFTRQLLKFQLPSPNHTAPPNEPGRFAIRPYLELLRLIRDAGSLSRTELELFSLTLTRWTDYDTALANLRDYRTQKSAQDPMQRAAFKRDYAATVFRRVYQAEIAAGSFGTRQGRTETEAEFLAKKLQTAGDYSDAIFRHLRATQLVTVNPRTFHLVISEQRREEVDYLLANVPREPVASAEYKAYLEDPSTPQLLQDDANHLRRRLETLGVVPSPGEQISALQQLLEITQAERQQASSEANKRALQHFGKYEEVEALFDKIIVSRPAIPDASLWLEWNIWRSMVMLNYAQSISPHFVADLDGLPIYFAPGNRPDLEADYGTFRLIVEVTRSSGHKQYEMEGEPVARHCGDAQRAAPAHVPVYCLFVAPKLNDSAVAHFFIVNKTPVPRYGGKTRIVPVTLAQFRLLLARGKSEGFANAISLQALLDDIVNVGRSTEEPSVWQQTIDHRIKTWLS